MRHNAIRGIVFACAIEIAVILACVAAIWIILAVVR